MTLLSIYLVNSLLLKLIWCSCLLWFTWNNGSWFGFLRETLGDTGVSQKSTVFYWIPRPELPSNVFRYALLHPNQTPWPSRWFRPGSTVVSSQFRWAALTDSRPLTTDWWPPQHHYVLAILFRHSPQTGQRCTSVSMGRSESPSLSLPFPVWWRHERQPRSQ
jgi:hypothetical protein